MRYLILVYFLIFSQVILAQEDDSYDIAKIVYLDSFTVSAARADFDTQDFIQLVMEDSSFYQAFRNLRVNSYAFDGSLFFFDKKGKQQASYSGSHKQVVDTENCRTMETLDEKVEGNYYKKKKQYRYYTAKMYAKIFFTRKKTCEGKVDPTSYEDEDDVKGMQKHINELKKLIFTPGRKADVPLIGKKTAIFEEDMRPFYEYSIRSELYQGEVDAYVFQAKQKEEFKDKKKKTVIKNLETYFDKETFQVLGRNYTLEYYGALFDLNVTMNIRLQQVNGMYIPTKIEYDGFWNIPTKKPENAKFNINFHSFN